MAKLNQGDAVVIAAREQTPQDIKSGLYYPHYGGLRGTILKLYGEEASILVERDSLPTAVRVRHEEGEKAMRQKWLDNLSDEARGRMNEREKQFALNYAVLVATSDLTVDKDGGSAARRVSARELDAAEEEFLAQRKAQTDGTADGNKTNGRKRAPGQ